MFVLPDRVQVSETLKGLSFYLLKVVISLNFIYFCPMYGEREIVAYKSYFWDFMDTLTEDESKKIYYILDMLKVRNRISEKFVKHIKDGLYELRAEYNSNIYRVFFCFDKGKVVILFNGFQKKTQKTPIKEINKALKIKEEYYGSKSEKR